MSTEPGKILGVDFNRKKIQQNDAQHSREKVIEIFGILNHIKSESAETSTGVIVKMSRTIFDNFFGEGQARLYAFPEADIHFERAKRCRSTVNGIMTKMNNTKHLLGGRGNFAETSERNAIDLYKNYVDACLDASLRSRHLHVQRVSDEEEFFKKELERCGEVVKKTNHREISPNRNRLKNLRELLNDHPIENMTDRSVEEKMKQVQESVTKRKDEDIFKKELMRKSLFDILYAAGETFKNIDEHTGRVLSENISSIHEDFIKSAGNSNLTFPVGSHHLETVVRESMLRWINELAYLK